MMIKEAQVKMAARISAQESGHVRLDIQLAVALSTLPSRFSRVLLLERLGELGSMSLPPLSPVVSLEGTFTADSSLVLFILVSLPVVLRNFLRQEGALFNLDPSPYEKRTGHLLNTKLYKDVFFSFFFKKKRNM